VKRILSILLLVAVAAFSSYWFLSQSGMTTVYYETMAVQRGPLTRTLRETGLVAPRDPVIIKSRIAGIIEWIVEDATWVNPDERIYVINDEQAMRQVTEARTSLFNRHQELALARLRRRHAEGVEAQKVIAAQRSKLFAETRLRILSSTPKGGRRLIEVHEALIPLETETQRVRDRYEAAQAVFQKSQDAYLEQLDAWQACKDGVLRLQAKIDEYLVRTEAKYDQTDPAEVLAREEDLSQLDASREKLELTRQALPALRKARDAAEAIREEASGPRDEARAELEAKEATGRDLYIALEIEKRAVPLVQLTLDRQISRLDLEEARRKAEEGRASYDSGAVSLGEVEGLDRNVAAEEKEVEILDERIAIAGRPTAAEILTEARLKLEQATLKMENAERVRDQNLKAIDREIEMLLARVDRLTHQINRLTRDFPAVITFGIRFLEKELEGLEPQDTDRLEAIGEELAQLRADQQRVKEKPPNIGVSSVGGVVKLVRRWGRVFNAGDDVDADTVLMEIFPATNLEVRMSLNESAVDAVFKDMPARIKVPALDGMALDGTVSLVGGVGRDKFHEHSDNDNPVFADVTEFESRVALTAVPESLRTGMTVIVEIELERIEEAIYLPRGAVQFIGGAATVLVGPEANPERRTIQGRSFGENAYIVASGLEADAFVLVERRRSR